MLPFKPSPWLRPVPGLAAIRTGEAAFKDRHPG